LRGDIRLKNFLVNVNIFIFFILAVALMFFTVEDFKMTKTTQDDARQYLISQTNPKEPFPTKLQKVKMEEHGIINAKRTVEKQSVVYECQIFVPSHMNTVMKKTVKGKVFVVPIMTN